MQSGVKGTFWVNKTDTLTDQCQLPHGNYSITDAVALGQDPKLATLIWRPGFCGQVLNIDCGHGVVRAVVASICNIGSGTCGVDMIRKTWNKATGNRTTRQAVTCNVTLSKMNPLNDKDMICYFEPKSNAKSKYFIVLGLLNTKGRITKSATVDGIDGTPHNDGWFMFNSLGKPLFVSSANVTFNFEDGGSVQKKLSDCRDAKTVQIFE